MKKALTLIFSLFTLTLLNVYGQTLSCDSSFCDPKLKWSTKPKGVVFKYEILTPHAITTTGLSDSLLSDAGKIKKHKRQYYKLSVPVVNRPDLSIVVGLKYYKETFIFRNSDLDYDLYSSLQDKALRSIGTNFYLRKSFRNNKFLFLGSSVRLNGDYNQLDEIPASLDQFMKISFNGVLGFKKSPTKLIGYGITYSYSFGVPSFAPVFVYQKNWNKNWGTSLVLPSKVTLRYNTNNTKNVFILGTELKGDSYNIHLDNGSLSDFNTLHLRKGEIRSSLTYEREIYDFLWFSTEVGTRFNFRFNLSESDKTFSDVMAKSRLGNAVFGNISLFLVPPKKLL